MKRYVLDANCFIDAVSKTSAVRTHVLRIFEAAKMKKLEIAISRHTLDELSKKPDAAFELAKGCKIIDHWPIGSWDDQVASWDNIAGSWDAARKNEVIHQELKALAKKGNSLRDRGAFLDAVKAACDGFVTSDRQLIDDKPKNDINRRFHTKVMRPQEVIC